MGRADDDIQSPDTGDISARIAALPEEDRWDATVREAVRVWNLGNQVHMEALASRSEARTRSARGRGELLLRESGAAQDAALQALRAAQVERDAHLSRVVAKATEAHSRNLVIATWVLAGATVALIVATVAS